ncbi:hypothetical protein [Novosphingobium kaempferiae]|uniref:hypothetical protein n=1 Tax=Novosphingobium kaempferiae TaxID=2896849 RepID=UPI001E41AD39|nr:hypothetical protein [Novosphingobium kaempferiae]
MDMIDRAARALAKEQSGVDVWDGLDAELQNDLRRDVRTVLEAMRDPEPDFGIPGERLLGDARGHSVSRNDMTDAWTAMIDGLFDD